VQATGAHRSFEPLFNDSLLHSPRQRSAQDRAFHPAKPCARSPARLRIDNDRDLKGISGA
jgi:hypothetical protein